MNMFNLLTTTALSPYALYADGDEGAGAGGAADGGAGGSAQSGSESAPAADNQPNWTQYVNALAEGNAALQGKFDTLIDEVRGLPTATAENTPLPPPDLEGMSRAEFASYIAGTIVDTMRSHLEGALAPINEQVTAVQSRLTEGHVQTEINTLSTQHKDFRDWKPEMISLANVHPTLTVTQLYSLARAENGDKAKTLDAKYTPAAPPRPPRFGGLAPGMPGGPALSEKPMSAKQAGEAAYREVAARYPGVLRALEDL